jgi:hypothetical protein
MESVLEKQVKELSRKVHALFALQHSNCHQNRAKHRRFRDSNSLGTLSSQTNVGGKNFDFNFPRSLAT